MGRVIIPEQYYSCLNRYETQEAIGTIKFCNTIEIRILRM